jgi:hypothetical protein
LALALPQSLNLSEVKPPPSEDISANLDRTLKAFGIKLDRKTLKQAEIAAGAKVPKITKDFNDMFLKSAQSSFLLITLAVLNVHLQQHHTLANHPADKVVYDAKLPMVARFEEIHALLQRCLNSAKLAMS